MFCTDRRILVLSTFSIGAGDCRVDLKNSGLIVWNRLRRLWKPLRTRKLAENYVVAGSADVAWDAKRARLCERLHVGSAGYLVAGERQLEP